MTLTRHLTLQRTCAVFQSRLSYKATHLNVTGSYGTLLAVQNLVACGALSSLRKVQSMGLRRLLGDRHEGPRSRFSNRLELCNSDMVGTSRSGGYDLRRI